MKLIKFLVIIVLFMFLLGCGSSSGPKQGIQNFKQGYGSLDVRFLDNSPPEKIYQGSKFKMIVELDNQAAYDLEGGQIKIMGVDEKFFLMSSPLTNDFSVLMGKSLVSPSGEKIFVEFDATALNELFEMQNVFKTHFLLRLVLILCLNLQIQFALTPISMKFMILVVRFNLKKVILGRVRRWQ